MSTSDTLSEVAKHRMFFVCSLRRYLVLYPAKEGSDERRDTSSGTALISVNAGVCADAEAYVREARPHWDWGGCTISLGALGSLTQSMTVESFEVHRVAR